MTLLITAVDVQLLQTADGKLYFTKLYAPWCAFMAVFVVRVYTLTTFFASMYPTPPWLLMHNFFDTELYPLCRRCGHCKRLAGVSHFTVMV